MTDPDENFTVMYAIRDEEGREVAAAVRPASDPNVTVAVPSARRWSVDDPYLYTITAILQRRNEAYDEVSAQVGVREFSCDPQKGFILNGAATPLRGVSRHQDKLYQGNALTRADHFEDARIIKELGANTIRLAHYQHAQYFYDLCDQRGLIAWAEIPCITEHLTNARANALSQMEELVSQCYNHPSIFCWGLSNEITVTGGVTEELVETHRQLNDLCHKLDPTRPTAMAHAFMLNPDDALVALPDVSSYNLYYGWYLGELEQNDQFFDGFHAKHPDMPIGLSEYGADANPQYQAENPEKGDYTESYQCNLKNILTIVLQSLLL